MSCTPLQREMSYIFGACEDSCCSRGLVFCSNSHIIHVVMVVGPCRPVSLTWVMMPPQRRGTHKLMDRSRCPPPLSSPKRTHVWNWFCHHYLPVGPPPPPPFLSVSHNSVQNTSHHKNTEHSCPNEEPVQQQIDVQCLCSVILLLSMCAWLTELPMPGCGFSVFFFLTHMLFWTTDR